MYWGWCNWARNSPFEIGREWTPIHANKNEQLDCFQFFFQELLLIKIGVVASLAYQF